MKINKGFFSVPLRILSVVMACVLLMGGCAVESNENGSGKTVTVYYSKVRSFNSISDPLVGVQVTIADDEGDVNAVLDTLWKPPERDDLESALPAELTVEKRENIRGQLSLWMSEYYLEMTGIGKTIATAALVHSLCGLEEVDSLTIYVGDTAVCTDLTKEDMLLYDKEADPYEREVKVFFSDEEGQFLYDYTYIYTVGGEDIIEQYVMDVLLGVKPPDGAVSYIPRTEVNDVYVEDEICTVDFSADFYEGRPDSPVTERVVIYSIVNTLTSIAGINSVQFLIDGEVLDYYVTIPLDKPLERNSNIKGDGNGKKISVFMWSEVLQELVELPVMITGEYRSEERAVLGTINAWLAETGYTNPVPAGTQFYADTQITDDLVIIDLSAEFQGSPAGDSAVNMELAIKAVTSALLNVYKTNNIKVISEGSDIIKDSTNLSDMNNSQINRR